MTAARGSGGRGVVGVLAGVALAVTLCGGCHARATPETPSPTVSTSDLDGVDTTVNGVERDVDDNG